MLISVLILGVLVVAAGFLLFTTPNAEAETPDSSVSNPTLSVPDDTDNVVVTNSITPPPSTEPPVSETPTPPPPPQVRSVSIYYVNTMKTDFTAKVGERVPLTVKVEPPGIEEDVIWLSSNRNVFEVVETGTGGTAATVIAIGKGTATLTVSVGGVEATCVVRVN